MSLVVTQHSHLAPEANEVYAAVLDLTTGDRLLVRDSVNDVPRETTWRVVRRARAGWLLEAQEGKFETFTDVRIRDLRCDGEMIRLHRNPTGMSVDKLRRVLTPRDAKSLRLQLELDRRLAYCTRVDALMTGREVLARLGASACEGNDAHTAADTPPQDVDVPITLAGPSYVSVMTLEEAAALAAERTYEDNIERWRERLREILARELAVLDVPTEIDPEDKRLSRSQVLSPPTARMVAKWWKLRNASDLPDLILTPDWASRGNRRPRKTELLEGRSVYDIMDHFGDMYYAVPEKVSVRRIYLLIERKHPGFKAIVKSHVTLQRHFDKRYADRYDLKSRRDGAAAANSAFGVHLRTRRPPLPLMEVEIDHCVADVIVVDDVSGTPLGRPYVTVMMDRCTRMILGVHLSFEQPSWASVARCMAHAIFPKDLRPYRRAVSPDDEFALDHDWPCEGVPEILVTDRGKEFTSRSMDASAAALGFGHLALPGRSPWLKGTIERFFGRMHVQVYSDVHGRTFPNVVERGAYDSVGRADLTLEQLRRRLLKWIVDEYHTTFHHGLGDYPLHAWRKRSSGLRVSPAPSLGIVQQMLGTYAKLPIGDYGMTLDTHNYWHESMQKLRNTHPHGTKYHVRYDPFDIGSIWFLPTEGGAYVRAWSVAPEDTDGVSSHVSKVRRRMVRRYGDMMTPEDDRKIVEEVDRMAREAMAGAAGRATISKVARYFLANGRFFTDVSDWDGVPPGFARRDAAGRPASASRGNEDVRETYDAAIERDRSEGAGVESAAVRSVQGQEEMQRRLVEEARRLVELEEDEE